MTDHPAAQPDTRQIIGWRERVDLPAWGVKRLLAKADTGARSSAVHAENIKELGDDRVAFDVVYSRAHPEHRERVEAPIARRVLIRSSTGHADQRLIVRTTLKVGRVLLENVEVGLVSRELMQCRLLIGRTALDGLLVDPSRMYLLTRAPKTTDKTKDSAAKDAAR